MPTPPKQCSECGAALGPRNRIGMCQRCGDRARSKKYAEKDNAQSRAWYAANRERALASNKAWCAANPELVRQRSKEWYEANREKDLQRSKEWREANREKLAEYDLQWARANPGKVRANQEARRARKLALYVEHVAKEVVWERDKGICHLCGQPADQTDWHLYHVISLDDGGPHCYTNTAVAHPNCNTSKGRSSRSSCGVRWSEATGAYQQFHNKEYRP